MCLAFLTVKVDKSRATDSDAPRLIGTGQLSQRIVVAWSVVRLILGKG
jgi:hypothetical protein